MKFRNKAHNGAYAKGFAAGRDGFTLETCPYADERTLKGAITFSRGLRAAWAKGWEDGKQRSLTYEQLAKSEGYTGSTEPGGASEGSAPADGLVG